jgi:nucleoside permease NupC
LASRRSRTESISFFHHFSARLVARFGELARLGLRAMVGGLLACYLTACIAGLLTP